MKKVSFILFLFYSVFIHAQTLKVSADKNPAIVGEQIVMQYNINTKGKNFKSPNFNGLQVLSGPNPSTQSSYTFVNGKSQSNSSTTYSFYLKARKEGTYNITPAKITVNGKTISSEPYTLNVVKGSEKDKAQQKALSNSLFITVNVSKRNIIVGEQIVVTYTLFTRVDLQNTAISSLPALNGFWAKDLETSSRFKREIIDGIPYNVATIKKSVLTAQKSGKLSIDPIELQCSIRIHNTRNNHDPFANFFGGNYKVQEEVIRSKTITVTVTDLPSPPANFKGAVGNINIKSEVDNTTINANDAINYKLTITGTGNIELIEPLNIQFPEDFEVYDPKISDKIFEGGLQRSIKTFEYLLIPRYKGEYTIPGANLIIYNPVSKKYETKKSSQHKLIINASLNHEDAKSSTLQQIIKTKQKDINYIFTKTNLTPIGENTISKNLFYLLFFLPIGLLILLRIYDTIIGKTNTNSTGWKNKKANKIALKRLKTAQKCINNSDFDAFFEEIEKSLWGYFADKFKVNSADLSKETITNYFSSSKINKQIEEQFITLLNECEFARYSPASNKNTQMDTILEKAKTIIINVETALK
ncbi:MAG: BatD family protein [Bacteroidota bacterium]|nr:BatD family protein [Bacteroidota bacterium]